MILFYAATIIILFGLGVVGWLLYSEKSKAVAAPVEELGTDAHRLKKKEETAAQLLNRLGLNGRGDQKDTEPVTAPPQKEKKGGFMAAFSKLTERNKTGPAQEEPWTGPLPFGQAIPPIPTHHPKDMQGTASIRTVAEPEIPEHSGTNTNNKERKWPAHVEATLELSQLKEKHARIEKLLAEKSQELEKAEKSLDIELRNRKEFNKVKDILEKEVKDNKLKARDLQIESTNAQTEAHGLKNRIDQLEQRITKFEKTILELEHTTQDKDSEIARLKDSLKKAESQPKKEESKPEPTAVQPSLEAEAQTQTPKETPMQTTTVPPQPDIPVAAEMMPQIPEIPQPAIMEKKPSEPIPEPISEPIPEPVLKLTVDPLPTESAVTIETPQEIKEEKHDQVTVQNVPAIPENPAISQEIPKPDEIPASEPHEPYKIIQKPLDKQQGLKDLLRTLEEPLPTPKPPAEPFELSQPASSDTIAPEATKTPEEPPQNDLLVPSPEKNTEKEKGGGKKKDKDQEYLKLPADIFKKDEIKPQDGKVT